MNRFTKVSSAVALVALLSACASTPELTQSEHSGFLKDYSKLQATDIDSEAHVWRWVNPKLADKSYKNLVIQPLHFYPAPVSSDQITLQSLEALRTRLTSVLVATANDQQLPLSPNASTGSLVLDAAITSVAASNKALSIRELIPIRLVVSGAELALGKRDKDLTVLIEYELTDYDTQQVMASGVRADEGLPLANNKTEVNMTHFEPVITDLIKDLETSLNELKVEVF